MPPGLSILRRISQLRECKQPDEADPKEEIKRRLTSKGCPSRDKEGDDLPSIIFLPEVGTQRSGTPREMRLNKFNLPLSTCHPCNEDMLNQLSKDKLLFLICDITKPHHPIIFASEGFFAFTEFSKAEVLNRNCSFLQGSETNPDTIQKIREIIKSRATFEEIILNYTKSGKKFWNLLNLVPLKPRDGQPIAHYLGILKDVTQSVETTGGSESDGLSEPDENVHSDNQSPPPSSAPGTPLRPMPPSYRSNEPRATRPSALRQPPRPPAVAVPQPNMAQLSAEFAQMRVIRESLAQQMATFSPVVVNVSEDGTVSSCTDACLPVFGYASAAVVGQPLTVLLDLEGDSDVWGWCPEPRVVRARHRDGNGLHLIATPAPVETHGGRRILPISFQNITTLKTIEEALQEKEHSLQALKMTMEHRKQFMNYIFHEVRQPFSVLTLGLQHIITSCEGIMSSLGPAADHLREPVMDIAATTRELITAGEAMHRILNDVLTLEKLQEGKMAIELSPNRVEDILANAQKQTACLFGEKDIVVEATVDEQLRGLQAAYDRCRLQQVMLNLLTNAQKFTPRGGRVTISLQCAQPVTDDAVEVEVRVTDDGVGISKAAQQQLFKPYVQLRAGELQEGGGTGLGLAITKGIIEAHGGTLGVDSAPDCGASFWFRLRLS